MAISHKDLLNLFRYMLEGRMIEEAIVRVKGGYHSCKGEEAVIIGTFYDLREEDVIVPHYRGSILASYVRGASLRKLLAGFFGKETGYTLGRYRGDVWGPFELNIIGMFSGALGSNISLGTGAALAAKLKKSDNVAVTTFGDGTSNQGDFHEAINMAAVLKLPAIYVCQNNQYAVSMPACKAMGCRSVADRAAGYGIPGLEVDGNDVEEVHEAVQTAVQRAREGDGPTLIDAKTYRILGHFASDPASYRPAEEVEKWKKKDPLDRLQKKLINKGIVTERAIKKMQEKMEHEISEAMKQAEEDAFPDEKVFGIDDVFASDRGEERS